MRSNNPVQHRITPCVSFQCLAAIDLMKSLIRRRIPSTAASPGETQDAFTYMLQGPTYET